MFVNMKKLTLSIITIFLVFVSVGFISPTTKSVEKDFCDGWDEGFQDALDACFGFAMTPLCPLPPIGVDSKSYKHGYGMGYAEAKKNHCPD